jgi:hypothetical protein
MQPDRGPDRGACRLDPKAPVVLGAAQRGAPLVNPAGGPSRVDVEVQVRCLAPVQLASEWCGHYEPRRKQ